MSHLSDRPTALYDPAAPLSGTHWGWQLAYGIVLLIGGAFAIFNPFAASLAATAIAAIVFVVIGLMQIFMAFRDIHGTASRIATGLLGLVMALFGIALFADPIGGILSLTLLIGLVFLAMGAVRLWIAYKLRNRRGWGWLAASGVVTLLLGIGTLFVVAAGDLAILGLFLGIDLLFAGGATLASAFASRRTT